MHRGTEGDSSELGGQEWGALRRRGNISLKRSAAGGESCKAGFFFIEY